MKKPTQVFLLTPLVLFCLIATAQNVDTNEQSIRDLIAQYAAARDQQDPSAIRRLFTVDADQLVSSGEWRRGQEVLVNGMLRSSNRNPGDRSITVERVRMLSEEVALADARYIIKGGAGSADRKMWSTFLAVREEGIWRLAAIRNMLPAGN